MSVKDMIIEMVQSDIQKAKSFKLLQKHGFAPNNSQED